MVRPSGDHAGNSSSPPDVGVVPNPRARSYTRILVRPLPISSAVTARNLPSGESRGSRLPVSGSSPSCCPEALNQVMRMGESATDWKTSTPVAEDEKPALKCATWRSTPCSVNTDGGPVMVNRSASNGCATMLRSRKYSSRPLAYSTFPVISFEISFGSPPSSEAAYRPSPRASSGELQFATYRKCLPSGRKKGHRWAWLLPSPGRSVAEVGVPPPAAILDKVEYAPAA